MILNGCRDKLIILTEEKLTSLSHSVPDSELDEVFGSEVSITFPLHILLPGQ